MHQLKTLDVERLRDLVTYDPNTGVFRWRAKRVGSRIGDVAGGPAPGGYRKITLDGRAFFEHRLAWAYVHGVWPEGQIDHINGIAHDNRVTNLRVATQSENKQNQRRAMCNNKSAGLLGVSFDRTRNKWRAKIMANAASHYLGRFDSREAAHKAYLEAKKRLHPTASINFEGQNHAHTNQA